MSTRLCLAALVATAAFAQAPRLRFTTRTQLSCPISISGILPFNEFGFESIVLHNERGKTIDVLNLKVIASSAAGEEVVESITVSVRLAPDQSKRQDVALGRIQALSRSNATAAILVVAAVDYADGTHWNGDEPVIYDPVTFERRSVR